MAVGHKLMFHFCDRNRVSTSLAAVIQSHLCKPYVCNAHASGLGFLHSFPSQNQGDWWGDRAIHSIPCGHTNLELLSNLGKKGESRLVLPFESDRRQMTWIFILSDFLCKVPLHVRCGQPSHRRTASCQAGRVARRQHMRLSFSSSFHKCPGA